MTRKKKTNEPIDEEANQRALDEAAGVARSRPTLSPDFTAEGIVNRMKEQGAAVITRPPNVAPLVKTDTREKLLYKVACTGTPLGNEFFDNFPDLKEVLDLALVISARLMVVAACNADLAPTQRISAIRVLASLAGKQVPDEEDGDKFTKPAPLAIPRGSKEEVSATLEKIRQLSNG